MALLKYSILLNKKKLWKKDIPYDNGKRRHSLFYTPLDIKIINKLYQLWNTLQNIASFQLSFINGTNNYNKYFLHFHPTFKQCCPLGSSDLVGKVLSIGL